jgi:hypothetical protein
LDGFRACAKWRIHDVQLRIEERRNLNPPAHRYDRDAEQDDDDTKKFAVNDRGTNLNFFAPAVGT